MEKQISEKYLFIYFFLALRTWKGVGRSWVCQRNPPMFFKAILHVQRSRASSLIFLFLWVLISFIQRFITYNEKIIILWMVLGTKNMMSTISAKKTKEDDVNFVKHMTIIIMYFLMTTKYQLINNSPKKKSTNS